MAKFAHIPMRRCVVCRAVKPKYQLWRIVKAEGGKIGVDNSFKAAGRGAYVCKDGDCSQEFKKLKKGIEWLLHQRVPQELLEMLGKELRGG